MGEKQWKIIKPSTKTVAVVTYKRWPFTRSYNNSALTRKILVPLKDGCIREVVANERWLHMEA